MNIETTIDVEMEDFAETEKFPARFLYEEGMFEELEIEADVQVNHDEVYIENMTLVWRESSTKYHVIKSKWLDDKVLEALQDKLMSLAQEKYIEAEADRGDWEYDQMREKELGI